MYNHVGNCINHGVNIILNKKGKNKKEMKMNNEKLPAFVEELYPNQRLLKEGAVGKIYVSNSKLLGAKNKDEKGLNQVAIKKVNIRHHIKRLFFPYKMKMPSLIKGEEKLSQFGMLRREKEEKLMDREHVENELELWSKISGNGIPFTIKLLDTLDFKKQIWMIMDYCHFGNLTNFLEKFTEDHFYEAENRYCSPNMEMVKLIMAGVFIAVRELNVLGIIHRDIKCENILLTKDYIPKLADFDISRTFDVSKGEKTKLKMDYEVRMSQGMFPANLEGTTLYIPPEGCVGFGEYNCTWDTFSLCLTMMSLKFGTTPWHNGNPEFNSDFVINFFRICHKNLEDRPNKLIDRTERDIELEIWQRTRVIPLFVYVKDRIRMPIRKDLEEYDFNGGYKKLQKYEAKIKTLDCNDEEYASLKERYKKVKKRHERNVSLWDYCKWDETRKEFSEFLQWAMRFNIDKRPTCREVCEHTFMIDSIELWERNSEEAAEKLRRLCEEGKEEKEYPHLPDDNTQAFYDEFKEDL